MRTQLSYPTNKRATQLRDARNLPTATPKPLPTTRKSFATRNWVWALETSYDTADPPELPVGLPTRPTCKDMKLRNAFPTDRPVHLLDALLSLVTWARMYLSPAGLPCIPCVTMQQQHWRSLASRALPCSNNTGEAAATRTARAAVRAVRASCASTMCNAAPVPVSGPRCRLSRPSVHVALAVAGAAAAGDALRAGDARQLRQEAATAATATAIVSARRKV